MRKGFVHYGGLGKDLISFYFSQLAKWVCKGERPLKKKNVEDESSGASPKGEGANQVVSVLIKGVYGRCSVGEGERGVARVVRDQVSCPISGGNQPHLVGVAEKATPLVVYQYEDVLLVAHPVSRQPFASFLYQGDQDDWTKKG
ncbi:hypothetical protein VNO78_10711 [Psophocarpus tetragonolobus]|uniref:Uncharacterized protein n=1 Tax=Psophocarpus tetragonolobus TaxID=3891 RepID=A0AAN9SL34_PSOTE